MSQNLYKNKLWVFGDSYSDRAGLIPELASFYKVFYIKDWAELLSEDLGFGLERNAMGGAGIEWIIDKLIYQITNIQKNDIVIISDTIITRLNGFDIRTNKINTLDNERLYYGEDVEEDNHLAPVYGKDKQRVVVDYTIQFIHEHYEVWEEYYINKIKALAKILKEKEVEVYFWSHRLWDVREKTRFAKIHEETDGLFRDSHWGSNGHQDFYRYMKSRIEKKEYFENV